MTLARITEQQAQAMEQVIINGDLGTLTASDQLKRCNVCHQVKTLSDFYRNPKSSGGHRGKCRQCHMAQTMDARRRRHPPLPTASPEQRFWLKVQRTTSDTCWIWTGAKSKCGYGMMRVHGRVPQYAHRFSYELHNSAILTGMTIDHTCFNRLCVNPSHLEMVSLVENIRRENARRWHGEERNG